MSKTQAAQAAARWPEEIARTCTAVAGLRDETDAIQSVAEAICRSLEDGGQVLTCGNGGSSLEAQHFAAELIGHFKRDRRSLPSLALTADSGVLTAIGNDYHYDDLFARQVEGLGRPGDVVIGFSTSGNSANVVRALERARGLGAVTVSFTGADGGEVAHAADFQLRAPERATAQVQECHLVLTHAICEYIDAYFAA